MAKEPITKIANGNITIKKGNGDGIKPGEKKVPSNYLPLKNQNVDAGSIRKMTAADTASFSKKGYRVDMSRSMMATQTGREIYQPEYIKLAQSKAKVTPVKKTTPAAESAAKPIAKAPDVTEKAMASAPKSSAPIKKDLIAYRSQTVIDSTGNRSVKTVPYQKFDREARKWVDQDAPIVVDYRTREKKYHGKKVVKF